MGVAAQEHLFPMFMTSGDPCMICGGGLSVWFRAPVLDGPYLGSRSICRRSFLRCEKCGHVLVDLYDNSQYREYYERLSPTYHVEHDEDTVRYQQITSLVHSLPNSKVLDFGCGSGTFLRMLPDSFRKFGVEPCRESARQAERYDITILREEELCSPDLQGSFDLITAIDVVEHTRDLLSLRTQLSRLLRPKGNLIVLTGDVSSVAARLARRRWYYMHYAEHITFFSVRSMRSWLDPAFCEVKVWPGSHHPFSTSECISIVKGWLTFPTKLALDLVGLRRLRPAALPVRGDHILVSARRR